MSAPTKEAAAGRQAPAGAAAARMSHPTRLLKEAPRNSLSSLLAAQGAEAAAASSSSSASASLYPSLSREAVRVSPLSLRYESEPLEELYRADQVAECGLHARLAVMAGALLVIEIMSLFRVVEDAPGTEAMYVVHSLMVALATVALWASARAGLLAVMLLSEAGAVCFLFEKVLELALQHAGEDECSHAQAVIVMIAQTCPLIYLSVLRLPWTHLAVMQLGASAGVTAVMGAAEAPCFSWADTAVFAAVVCVLIYVHEREERRRFVRTLVIEEERVRLERSSNDVMRYIFHEVRVPFNAIFLGLEVLEEQPDLLGSMLGDMKGQAEQLRQTLDDVASFQKLCDGEISLFMRPFSPGKLVKGVAWSHRVVADDRGVALEAVADASVPRYLVGDEQRLRQVLTNMVSNALKFTPRGGRVTVEVAVLAVSPDEDTANAAGSGMLVISPDIDRHSGRAGSSTPLSRSRNSTPKNLSRVPSVSRGGGGGGGGGGSGGSSSSGGGGSSSQVPLNQAPTPSRSRVTTPRVAASSVSSPSLGGGGSLWLQFSVRDTGVGMSDAVQQHLFRNSMPVNAETHEEAQHAVEARGSGLGLKICGKLVELHGGYIKVDSRQGRGTTFMAVVEVGKPTARVRSSSRAPAMAMPTISASTDATSVRGSALVAHDHSAWSDGSSSSEEDEEQVVDDGDVGGEVDGIGTGTEAGSVPAESPLAGPARSSSGSAALLALDRRRRHRSSRDVSYMQPDSVHDGLCFASPAGSKPRKMRRPRSGGSDRVVALGRAADEQPQRAAPARRPHTVAASSQRRLVREAVASGGGGGGGGGGRAAPHKKSRSQLHFSVSAELLAAASALDGGGERKASRVEEGDEEDASDDGSGSDNDSGDEDGSHRMPPRRVGTDPLLTSSQRARPAPSRDEAAAAAAAPAADASAGAPTPKESPASRRAPSRSPSQPRVGPDGLPRRILVVEDNMMSQRMMVRILTVMKFEVVTADNGLEAVELFEKGGCRVDLVFMDGTMPLLNGVDATARLRGMGVRVPIVALTGNALMDDRERFLSAGVDAVLTKPASIKKLNLVMEQFLGRPSTPGHGSPAAK